MDIFLSDLIPAEFQKIGKGALVEKEGPDQAIGAAAWTKITWDTEIYDHEEEFDLPNDRFIAARSGIYLIIANIGWTGVANGDTIYIAIYRNAASERESQNICATGDDQSFNTMVCLDLDEDDIIEIYVFTSAANSVKGTGTRTFANIVYQGPKD